MTKKRKRFVPLKDHKGIRKDLSTGKYVVRKYIDGKEYCETFDKISNAVFWRRNFHPLLTDTEINIGVSTKFVDLDNLERIQTRPNGTDKRFTFKDVWELYKKQYFPSLEPQTIDDRLKFAKHFFPDLMKKKMVELSPEFLDLFIEKKVNEARLINNPRRKNFDNDLKVLKAIFNWYRENYDGMFVNPILKRHYVAGTIKPRYRQVSRKMTLEQVKYFLDSFEDLFWRDFAEMHFFMAGRVQEVAGLQKENVDLDKGMIKIFPG